MLCTTDYENVHFIQHKSVLILPTLLPTEEILSLVSEAHPVGTDESVGLKFRPLFLSSAQWGTVVSKEWHKNPKQSCTTLTKILSKRQTIAPEYPHQ